MTGTVTIFRPTGLVPGDRVKFSGDTNRMRRVVAGIDSETEFRTLLFVRPSRGWRRHVRRMKQLKRRASK